jgi:hypothetical protein
VAGCRDELTSFVVAEIYSFGACARSWSAAAPVGSTECLDRLVLTFRLSWLPNFTMPQIAGAVRGVGQTDLKALVWDRGASHRTATVRAIGMPLVELPPDSPELNPAERVFEEIRRRVEGKIYATLDDKVAKVTAYLGWLEAHPERVRSLTHWSWIAAALQHLPIQGAA